MSRSGAKPLLGAAVLGLAGLFAILSVRDWVSRSPRSHPVKPLAVMWPAHPDVATEQLMLEAALAARSNSSLGPRQRDHLRKLAAAAPLRPQPFLLEGAVAQMSGDFERALRLYRAARLRDPRDPAARLVLADLQLRNGRIEDGLSNLVAIARIEPKKSGPVAPALAEYAKAPGAATEIRGLFAKNPSLAGAVLNELAADPSNAALIQQLAPPSDSGTVAPWQQRLIDSTLAMGRVREAQRLWSASYKVQLAPTDIPFNPAFRMLPAGAPFNWAIFSGRGGIAELRPGGGLSVVHFGRDPVMLARQLLALSPGRYEVRTRLDRPLDNGRLQWQLRCAATEQAQTIPLNARGRTFESVPACSGYWLELHAVPDETEQQLERVVQYVALQKVM